MEVSKLFIMTGAFTQYI